MSEYNMGTAFVKYFWKNCVLYLNAGLTDFLANCQEGMFWDYSRLIWRYISFSSNIAGKTLKIEHQYINLESCFNLINKQ